MKATVKVGQTLLDVAIEHKGTWEAAMDMARINGISVTDTLETGTELTLPDGNYDTRMEQWCKNNDVSPATDEQSVYTF